MKTFAVITGSYKINFDDLEQASQMFIDEKRKQLDNHTVKPMWLVAETEGAWSATLNQYASPMSLEVPPWYAENRDKPTPEPPTALYAGDLSHLDPLDRWIVRNIPQRPKPNPYTPRPPMTMDTARQMVENIENRKDDDPLTFDGRRAIDMVNSEIEPGPSLKLFR